MEKFDWVCAGAGRSCVTNILWFSLITSCMWQFQSFFLISLVRKPREIWWMRCAIEFKSHATSSNIAWFPLRTGLQRAKMALARFLSNYRMWNKEFGCSNEGRWCRVDRGKVILPKLTAQLIRMIFFWSWDKEIEAMEIYPLSLHISSTNVRYSSTWCNF